ncbi:HPr kinase/phosphorylase [Sinorhizobium sp. BG8]|uniref:HPr kinase/phosphorylase n=1 Tax=Sinorhizobium sp. BG8 TaxID=2613773 RepID=UPI00193CB326|nr:HPr kinase/phosphorylase [Sinorhizobium sp. BG8]QRM53674.1 HPr kinase/phosphorylase [Sinorhizobium sp. BG8]
MFRPVNVHATAIVIGTTGLIFFGQSGAGKTSVALHCIKRSRARGNYAALISDDQVMLSIVNTRVVGRPPPAIAGLAEIRGAGIFSVKSIPCALLHRAILIVQPSECERMAPENETHEVLPGHFLPASRLPLHAGSDPFDILTTIAPELHGC